MGVAIILGILRARSQVLLPLSTIESASQSAFVAAVSSSHCQVEPQFHGKTLEEAIFHPAVPFVAVQVTALLSTLWLGLVPLPPSRGSPLLLPDPPRLCSRSRQICAGDARMSHLIRTPRPRQCCPHFPNEERVRFPSRVLLWARKAK